ncbi:MAG: hypothetical protein ACQEP1_00155 [Nanobdellota archaeon]
MANTSIDTPLYELTFRKYEKDDSKDRRARIRKFCLSLGLLQPGDSRDIIVDVLKVLIDASEKRLMLGSEDIREKVIKEREKKNLAMKGIASSNIRRQLKRLRDMFFVEKIKNKYRISEFMSLSEIFQEKIMKYLLPDIISRIKEYMQGI